MPRSAANGSTRRQRQRTTTTTGDLDQARLSLEERRQRLADALLDDVERLRRQMFAPAVVHTFDRDGQLRTGRLEEPTFGDKRAIATSVAILIDKVQLLTGQPTDRIDHRGDLDREIEELLSQVAGRG